MYGYVCREISNAQDQTREREPSHGSLIQRRLDHYVLLGSRAWVYGDVWVWRFVRLGRCVCVLLGITCGERRKRKEKSMPLYYIPRYPWWKMAMYGAYLPVEKIFFSSFFPPRCATAAARQRVGGSNPFLGGGEGWWGGLDAAATSATYLPAYLLPAYLLDGWVGGMLGFLGSLCGLSEWLTWQ